MNHSLQHIQFFSDLLSQKPDLQDDPRVHVELEGAAVRQRNDEAALSAAERARFISAIQKMMQEGTYQRIATIHAEMQHTMHGSMGRLGLNRFLAWHRRFLLAFEQELQRTDVELNGNQTDPLFVPYWRWSENREFPAWLKDVPPAFGNGGPNSSPPPRQIGMNGALPTKTDVAATLNDNEARSGLGGQFTVYEKFTYCLEGWADNLPGHNDVHSWVGGVMDNTSFSPADPIFWLHHCEIDRIWWIWQQAHKNDHPPYDRSRLQLDPWLESNYYTALDLTALGYTYASLVP